jgi:aminomethyltransferase
LARFSLHCNMSSAEPALRRTPLFEEHRRLGAKMIGFGGWEMPVFYSGIVNEHLAVRHRVGVFDISHMGQLTVEGPGSAGWLDAQLTNNLRKLGIGDGQYSLMLNERGGVIDDLIVYRTGQDRYLLVVNAALIDQDFAHLRQRLSLAPYPGVELRNESDSYAAVAVQGPRAAELFSPIGDLPARNQTRQTEIGGAPVWIARTGYTGEDGFEAFFPAATAAGIWREFLSLGQPYGILPCGLGARDTLRLEAGLPLNGADLSPERTPLAAGLRAFVDLAKNEFQGRAALLAELEHGLTERLTAIKVTSKAPPPRAHYPLLAGGRPVGELTSGSLSPSLQTGIGLGYLPVEFAKPGQALEIEIRGKRFPATVERKPLYKSHASPGRPEVH